MSHDSTPHERTEALEHHLEEHGHVHHDDVDAAIVAREMAFESGDGPSPALGAKIVARAWTDPEFKARLVDDGTGGRLEGSKILTSCVEGSRLVPYVEGRNAAPTAAGTGR